MDSIENAEVDPEGESYAAFLARAQASFSAYKIGPQTPGKAPILTPKTGKNETPEAKKTMGEQRLATNDECEEAMFKRKFATSNAKLDTKTKAKGKRTKVAVQPVLTDDDRPQVEISTNESETVLEAIAALADDATLYTRGRQLVSAGRDNSEGGFIERKGALVIISVPPGNLRERLTLHGAVVRRTIARGAEFFTPEHPPTWLVSSLFQRGEWPKIPPLRAIVNHPVLAQGGRILKHSGYDAASGLLIDTDLEVRVPEKPSAGQIRIATQDLLRIISDFQFASPIEAHRSAWLSAVLTLFARPAIDGPCPLFLADKNIRGAGGSLLVDSISMFALGQDMPRMSETTDGEEQRKRITSVLLAGDEAVLVDNVEHGLGGSALDAVLTSTAWRDRVLGRSEMTAVLPALTVWFATGNNVQVSGDTVRRVLPMRIETTSEHPETRDGFVFPNLRKAIRERRSRLAGCALTLLRGFIAAGSPDQKLTPWGTYEAWTEIIRNTIVWAGLQDPTITRTELLTIADKDRGGILGLFEAIEAMPILACNAFTAAKIVDESKRNPKMLESLEEMNCMEKGSVSVRLLTWKLKKARDRMIGGRKLVISEENARGNLWRLVHSVKAEAKPTIEKVETDLEIAEREQSEQNETTQDVLPF